MAVTPSNTQVAVTGAVSKGLTSATAPAGTASTLTGFTDLGGIAEDGVTLTLPGNGDKTPIKVWQNGATVRTVRGTSDDLPTLQFTLLETSLSTIQTYFGVTVTQTATEGSFQYTVQNRGSDSYVLDVIDGANLTRIYVPNGIVSSVGDLIYKHTDAIGYQITLDCDLDPVKGYNFKTWLTALHS